MRSNVTSLLTLPCTLCGAELPDDEFFMAQRNTLRRGRGSQCKKCFVQRQRERRALRTPEKIEEHNAISRRTARRKRLRKYGLTPETFAALLDRQGGVCAICRKPETTKQPHRKSGDESLAVDHCHETGKVRGLLCFMCNTALGKFNDDPDLMRRAIAYIEADVE